MTGGARVGLFTGLTALLALSCWQTLSQRGPDTDLLSLLPASESLPEADLAARGLAAASGNRLIVLIESENAAVATKAADEVAADLGEEPTLASALSRFPKPDLSPLRRVLAASHDRLPGGGKTLVERLDARVGSPFPDPLAAPLPADPFGIAADWMRGIPWSAGGVTWDDGFLRTRHEGKEGVIVVATFRSAQPSLDEQAAAVRRLDAALARAGETHGKLEVSRLGGAFHAAAAQGSARRDVDLIGIGSLLGILLLMLGVFRSPRMLGLCLGSIVVGLVAGMAATLGAFGGIHLLTLVFGASLLGEAADYSIQLTAARLSRPHDPDWRKAVMPGLTLALGTSLLGYAATTLIPLPLVRQIGVFALVGIGASYLFVRFLGPAFLGDTAPGKVPAVFGRMAEGIEALSGRIHLRHRVAAAALAAAGAVWTAFLPADDDIRSLVNRPADLVASESRMAAITGNRPSTVFILLRPEERTDDACLALAEKTLARLEEMRTAGVVDRWQSLAQLVPSMGRQALHATAHAKAWDEEGPALTEALDELGLAVERSPTPALEIEKLLELDIATPFRALRLEGTDGPAHLIQLSGTTDGARLGAGLSGLEGVHVVDKVGAISAALGGLRRWGAAWIALALILSLGLLAPRHGIRGGARLLLPVVLGLSWACPLAHLAGVPLSIFSLLALTLVLGVGLNYGIFLVEGGLRDGAALAGVLASAATTLISFGLLAFAEMPALSWLGTTLAAGILISLVSSPLALAPRRG